jgi:O-antigen/teichoic acid export membrane protein
LSFELFRENLKYGLKAYLSSFFAFMMLRVDILMVQFMGGAELAGHYSIAANMIDMVYILPAVIGTIIFPRMAALEDNSQKWKLSIRASLLVGAVMLPLIGVAAVLAKPAVLLLFGRAFLPAVPAFLWLLPGILFYGASFSLQYLLSIGLPRFVLWIWVAIVSFNVILNCYFIPHYGIVGAAWVSSMTYFLCFLVFTAFARRSANA